MMSLGPFNFGSSLLERTKKIELFYKKLLRILNTFDGIVTFHEPNDYYKNKKKLAGVLWTQAHDRIGLHLGVNILPLIDQNYESLCGFEITPALLRENLIIQIYKACQSLE